MKKTNNKKKGNGFEEKVRKTILSGGLPTDPLDLSYGDYVIECKITDQKGYRISLDLLEKIWNQSLSMNKMPYLIIGVRRNEKQIFTLQCKINLENY